MAEANFVVLWEQAGRRYAELSGRPLKDLPMPQTTEELIQSVTDQNGLNFPTLYPLHLEALLIALTFSPIQTFPRETGTFHHHQEHPNTLLMPF